MGKPTAADLRLGLATAPVLFAAQEVNEINIDLDRLMDLLHHARFVPDSDTISRVNDKWRKIMYKMYYLVLENYQAKGLVITSRKTWLYKSGDLGRARLVPSCQGGWEATKMRKKGFQTKGLNLFDPAMHQHVYGQNPMHEVIQNDFAMLCNATSLRSNLSEPCLPHLFSFPDCMFSTINLLLFSTTT